MVDSVYLTNQNNFKHCFGPQNNEFFCFYVFKKSSMMSQ